MDQPRPGSSRRRAAAGVVATVLALAVGLTLAFGPERLLGPLSGTLTSGDPRVDEDDAVPARPGVHVRPLLVLRDPDRAWGLTPDGELVLALDDRIRLVDPRTGRRTTSPRLDLEQAVLVQADERRVVMALSAGRSDTLWVWTRGRTTWSTYPVPDLPARRGFRTSASDLVLTPEDRVYVTAGREGVPVGELFSYPLDRPDRVRAEGPLSKTTLAMTADAVVWATPEDTLVVTPLAGGRSEEVALRGCEIAEVTGHDVLAVWGYGCGAGSDYGTRLVSLSGATLAELAAGADVLARSAAGPRVAFAAGSGHYVYDTATEELLRLSEYNLDLSRWPSVAGDVVVWGTGRAGRDERLHVGRLR